MNVVFNKEDITFQPDNPPLMHKLRLLIALTVISFSSFAQEQKAASLRSPTQKDNMLAGANLLMMVDPDDIEPNPSREHYNVGVSPRFGYFISDNLALGIDLTVSNEHSDRYRVKILHTKFGVFGRYYTGKAFRKNGTINKLRFFAEAGAAYGRVNHQNDDYLWSDNLLDLRIMAGVNYFVKPRIALEFGLNGTFEFLDHQDDARFIYSPNLGLQFFFSGR